jgi:hypothetical protein
MPNNNEEYEQKKSDRVESERNSADIDATLESKRDISVELKWWKIVLLIIVLVFVLAITLTLTIPETVQQLIESYLI